MKPSLDQPPGPPPHDSSVFSVAAPVGIGLLVGAGVGILLGRTWLAPRQPTTPPATSRINPGGGIKGALFQNNGTFDAPGLKNGAILQQTDDCWAALFRLSPSERASILWQWWTENLFPSSVSGNDVLAQLYAFRWDAQQQACTEHWWPGEREVMDRLQTLRALIGLGSALERALCQKAADYAAGRPTTLYDLNLDCTIVAVTPPPTATAYPHAPPETPLPPPIASPKPNILLTDFDACQRAFAALTPGQQGRVADEMLRRFGFSGYIQVEGDAALGSRLREIRQAAQAKVGSTTLQPKFVNARLRALRVALGAAGQDRRDMFCQLVADAPRAFSPGGALDPLAMSFPVRR